jgi:PTS system nitrogen regulatory IIA component
VRLTVRDVARLIEVSEKTVYRWVGQRKLPGYRVNEQLRFNRAELLEWATANRVTVSPELFAEPETAAAPAPTLAQALGDGGINYRVGGEDVRGVLSSVVEIMRLPEEVDREFLLEVLLAREGLQSTAVGDGIAIPHPRSPIVLHLTRPTMTLCFLERAIDFGAIDGRPVHTLLTIVSPTARAHLQLLSRLAFALRDAAFRAVVDGVGSRAEIVAAAEAVDRSLAARTITAEAGGARP